MSLQYQHECPPKNIDLGQVVALIGRANASLSRYDGLLESLIDTPVFRANELHRRLNIQRQRAAQYIRSLKGAGIIVELRPSSGSKPALLSFEELWRITDQQ